MALMFTNIRTGETRVADSEPFVAALYNSSDLSPNAHQGQDFGWRLAPEVVVRMRSIRKNPQVLESIAVKMQKSSGEIDDTDILFYIADITPTESAPMVQEGDYESEYFDKIRALEQAKEPSNERNTQNTSKSKDSAK